MATDNTPINEDDDLFNFDAMLTRGGAPPAPATAPPKPQATSPAPATAPPKPQAAAPAPAAALPKPQATAPAPPTALPKPQATSPAPSTAPPKPQAKSTTPADSSPKPAIPVANGAPVAVAPAVAPARGAPVHTEPAQVMPPASAAPEQIGQVKPVAPRGFDAAMPDAVAPVAGVSTGRQRVSALTLSALLVATLLNVALVGVVWRSMSGMGDALREVGDHVAHANEQADARTPNTLEAWQDNSTLAPATQDGELALSMAREEIDQGEFEHARMRLFSLLSVIDRFDAKSRHGLASRAQVLAADAFRGQADAIEREAGAAAGVLDAPKEHR